MMVDLYRNFTKPLSHTTLYNWHKMLTSGRSDLKLYEITDWLLYFSNTVLHAQDYTQSTIDFLIEITKLYDRVRGQLNQRQEKVIERIFREGLEGFKGGLSAENYIAITGTSRATATRDLQSLVGMDALLKTGALKGTRYHLNIKLGLANHGH